MPTPRSCKAAERCTTRPTRRRTIRRTTRLRPTPCGTSSSRWSDPTAKEESSRLRAGAFVIYSMGGQIAVAPRRSPLGRVPAFAVALARRGGALGGPLLAPFLPALVALAALRLDE